MANKERLIDELKKNNVDITDIDLDEIINLYDLYINYAIEKYEPFGKVTIDKFHFMNVPDSECTSVDYQYYNIFVNIIKIKKRGLLKYLDYILMNYVMKPFSTDPLSELFNYTNDVLTKIHNGIGNNIPVYFNIYDDIACEVICGCRYGDIVDSKYVNEEYKTITFTYNDLFCNYYHDGWCDKKKYFDWKKVLNYTHIFFVTNDLFNKEPERVNKFLQSLMNDIYNSIDKIQLYGIDDYNKLVLYIGKLYNEFDQKVKIIK